MTDNRGRQVWGFKQITFLVCLLVLAGTVSADTAEQADTDPADKGVVLLLLPTLTLQEAAHLPEIGRLLQSGSSALASSRIGRWQGAPFAPLVPDPIISAYYTMATGSPSIAGREGALILEAGEYSIWGLARDVWGTFSSRMPTGQAYAPFAGQLHRIAEGAPYPTYPGKLGDILEENGVRPCVIGNADTNDLHSREAGLFVMAFSGEISAAKLKGGITKSDPDFPFGVRTDNAEVLSEIRKRFQDTRFIVVETGDLLRFARAETTFTSEGRLAMRARILLAADALAGEIAESLPEGWRLVIASPVGPRVSEAAADRPAGIVFHAKARGSGKHGPRQFHCNLVAGPRLCGGCWQARQGSALR